MKNLKKWTILCLICLGFVSQAQDKRWNYIPEGTDLIVQINMNNLIASKTFQAIAASGEVESLHDDLAKIPWNTSKSVPDPIIIYSSSMGSSYATLVETDRSFDDLKQALTKSVAGRKTISSSIQNGRDMLAVDVEKTNRHTKEKYQKRESEILYLSSGVVAFGRDGHSLYLPVFTKPALPESTFAQFKNTQKGQMVNGLIRKSPIQPKDDPTGLASLIQSGNFVVNELEDNSAEFIVNFECKGEKEATQAARRLKSFIRIALVTLFSADKDLFKELNSLYQTSNHGANASLEITISGETLDRIRAFYLKDRDKVKSAASSVIKGKGSSNQ